MKKRDDRRDARAPQHGEERGERLGRKGRDGPLSVDATTIDVVPSPRTAFPQGHASRPVAKSTAELVHVPRPASGQERCGGNLKQVQLA